MAGDGDDPFDSLTQLCVLSDSQEDILRRCSFAGNPKSVDGSGSSDCQVLHPTGVLIASLPESSEQREQVTPHDAPPEQSVEQQPMAVDDPSLGDAAVGSGAEVTVEGGCASDVATGVDWGKNPDLGFRSQVQSTQQTEIEIIGGVRRREFAESEAGGEGKSASKRLNVSNEALGSSSAPIVVDLDSAESDGEDSSCDKKKKIVEKEEGKKRVETSQSQERSKFKEIRNLDPWRRGLPSRINASKDKSEKNPKGTEATPSDDVGTSASTIMEILKFLAEKGGEVDENLANMNILEMVTRRGMTFPRPCWWPEGEDYDFKSSR